jgi:hypothetical protein
LNPGEGLSEQPLPMTQAPSLGEKGRNKLEVQVAHADRGWIDLEGAVVA